MADGRVVGIDLGTTNSLVAYMQGEAPVVIRLKIVVLVKWSTTSAEALVAAKSSVIHSTAVTDKIFIASSLLKCRAIFFGRIAHILTCQGLRRYGGLVSGGATDDLASRNQEPRQSGPEQ